MPATTDIQPILINVRATAQVLGISERKVWDMAAKGQLPKPVHLGGSTRWRIAELNAYVESLETDR